MNKSVVKLRIIGDNDAIFSSNTKYIIPLYQRAFAWGDKQLIQLIEDISDVAEGTEYCIGTLTVSKQQDNLYEVVDGQQRLTSLYLLLKILDIKEVKLTLTFACRDKSNYTIEGINHMPHENWRTLDVNRAEPSILKGIAILDQELSRDSFNIDAFRENLSKVVMYRIEVPEHTDLNRYFEIMNTRGEQLEQHDILKARLMGYLKKENDKKAFAKIWDACSDMTGYVQMHFTSKNNEIREKLFGKQWNEIPLNDKWDDYTSIVQPDTAGAEATTIETIIGRGFEIEDDEGYADGDGRVRFESVIDFPYFLLHTLRVFITLYGIKHESNEQQAICDELLDDKKLIEAFVRVIDHGEKTNSDTVSKINAAKEDFSKEFILCLLRTRYLFDQYIIKREYTNNNADGEWSLKQLCVSGQGSMKKPYYKNTKFRKHGEHSKTSEPRVKTNIMIQSAMRVSYTSPKVMHWITDLLKWLCESNYQHINSDYIIEYCEVAEGLAIEAVNRNFFEKCIDNKYAMGVNTPHIVFNFLDYLLWKSNIKGYGDYAFEFRNSVEHWYPQIPLSLERWVDGVDRFGNLCIIQRSLNSKFSNLSPEAKKSQYNNMIAKGSLKLRKMSERTKKDNDASASSNWINRECEEHEKEMLDILIKACAPNVKCQTS